MKKKMLRKMDNIYTAFATEKSLNDLFNRKMEQIINYNLQKVGVVRETPSAWSSFIRQVIHSKQIFI